MKLLGQIEVAVANGKTTAQACKEAEIVEQTYFRWRKERQRKMTLLQKLRGVDGSVTDAEQTATPRMTNMQDLTLRRRADEPTSSGISE